MIGFAFGITAVFLADQLRADTRAQLRDIGIILSVRSNRGAR